MGKRSGERSTGPKCVAIVGPFASGKTSLFEALLARTGAIPKQAAAGSGNTVGDHSPEAKAHKMSVEATIASTVFMGESITFVDCPGSVEFAHEAEPVLAAADMAVVVAEPDEKKLPALQLTLRRLDDLGIPHVLFLNKIDRATAGVRETLQMLQTVSRTPMLLRQIPDLEGRHRHRLHRPRAGARLCLPRACAIRNGAAGRRRCRARNGSALFDAGEAGGP
jgi:elongation factor G